MCFYTDPCEAISSVIRTARKEHVCSECGKVIPAKTDYRFTSGIFEGDPFSHKECTQCTALRRRIADEEIAKGCHVSESAPALFDLIVAAKEHGYIP